MGNNQLSKNSQVILKNHGALKALSQSDITNTVKVLTIEGKGIVHFEHHHSDMPAPKSKYYIYIDNLIINQGSRLVVQGWKEGRDFLFVRKTSPNLADALTKLSFQGYDPANINLRDYNRDYWQISALPEPTAYGALLSIGGIGLWAWRQRKRLPRS